MASELATHQFPHGARKGIGTFEIALTLVSSTMDAEGNRFLTSGCITRNEWDHQIASLISQLERLRKDGYEFLPNA
jgi:hypothetical protein